MANTKISDLTASASNLASTDLAPIVQTPGVGPVKMTGLQLAGGLLGSATFNAATVTTSQPVLNLSQTWNAGAVAFTGLKFNATDTASASASLLADLQVGGSSKFNVDKSGVAVVQGVSGASPRILIRKDGDAAATVEFGLDASNNGRFGIGPGGSTSRDMFISRGGPAATQLGLADAAAPVAQTFKVQGVVAGTSNTAGANFTIQGSQGTGDKAGGSIIFQVAPAGSSGTAQNAYSTALTIDSTRRATFAGDIYIWPSLTYISNVGSQYLFSVTVNGGFAFRASNIAFQVNDSYSMGFVSDTFLWRDAANTLALKNSTNPQIFRVYSTTASSGSYGIVSAGVQPDGSTTASDTLYIGSAGAGAAMTKLALVVNGTTRLDYNSTNANSWSFSTHFWFASSGALIGASTGNDSLITGSVANDLCLRVNSKNILFSVDGGGSASVKLTSNKSLVVGSAALATTATDGFLYVPTCAGLPTGTPTTQTGTAPIVVDTTNNKLYFYSGGAWRDAGP